MASLFILSASLQRVGGAIGAHLTQFTAGLPEAARATGVLLYPAALQLDHVGFGTRIAYDTAVGLEINAETWRPLLHTFFTDILVVGTEAAVDLEEIVLACFLNGLTKRFVGGDGTRDLAPWQAQMRPDLNHRPVQVRPLAPEEQRAYVRTVHRWLGGEMIRTDFMLPQSIGVARPETLLYTAPRLAIDLAQHTAELQHENHGASFSIMRCIDGTIVHSPDFYRSIANFIGAIDGIESVLDVGCGSGFLACHLAASGRYRDVLGIDAALPRVQGARLHAELRQSTARFEQIGMHEIALPDKSVDVSVTSFALEQSGAHLERCIAEIRRVTRKLMVLFEPTTEFFATLPSQWHVPYWGWANQYHEVLVKSGLAYAVRPGLLRHYFNPATVFVIDLESPQHPCLRYPQLFGLGVDGWPGGVTVL